MPTRDDRHELLVREIDLLFVTVVSYDKPTPSTPVDSHGQSPWHSASPLYVLGMIGFVIHPRLEAVALSFGEVVAPTCGLSHDSAGNGVALVAVPTGSDKPHNPANYGE